jgi:hypothetical protein
VYDATQNTRTDYIPGPAGPLARIKRVWGGTNTIDTVTYLHTDHQGTARAGTDDTGAVLWEDFHTPFGDSFIAPRAIFETKMNNANDNQGDYTGHIRDTGEILRSCGWTVLERGSGDNVRHGYESKLF